MSNQSKTQTTFDTGVKIAQCGAILKNTKKIKQFTAGLTLCTYLDKCILLKFFEKKVRAKFSAGLSN